MKIISNDIKLSINNFIISDTSLDITTVEILRKTEIYTYVREIENNIASRK